MGYGHSRGDVRAAWQAFEDFAATPVRASDLARDDAAEGLLYEYGVYDFGAPWHETFQLDWTRQFATRDDDTWQVRLTVHLPIDTFGRPAPEDTLWSWDAAKRAGRAGQHRAWERRVAASTVFKQVLQRHLRPIGYELEAGSAE